MFAEATYFGFYPLGSDVVLHGIKIMQAAWNHHNSPVIVFGKKHTVSPLLSSVYYVTSDEQTVFFAAIEHGLGRYHIFLLDTKAQQRLRKRIFKK